MVIARDVLATLFTDSIRSTARAIGVTEICGNPLKIRVFKRAR